MLLTHGPDQPWPRAPNEDVYATYTPRDILVCVGVPVTTRLDPAVVDALDRAVAAGLAANRAAVISTAVREWLASHGEDAIATSYRRRYAEPEREHDELLAQLASFSVAACLATNER